jgi:hypothetical protein
MRLLKGLVYGVIAVGYVLGCLCSTRSPPYPRHTKAARAPLEGDDDDAARRC